MDKRKTILITGANGFTGQHACSYFSERGYKVLALVRNRRKLFLSRERSGDTVVIQCDLTDRKQVDELLQSINPDYVLHCAGKNNTAESWTEPGAYLEINVMATVNLLDALRKNKKAPRVLVVGSALERPPEEEPDHPYGLSKTVQTFIAKSWNILFHMPVVIAKPVNLIGPGPSMGVCSLLAEKIAKTEAGMRTDPVIIKDLSQKRDFLHVRDALHAYQIILERGIPGRIYPVETGVKRSLAEVIGTFRSLTETEPPVIIKNHQSGKNDDESHQRKTCKININGVQWEPSRPFRSSIKEILEYHRSKIKCEP